MRYAHLGLDDATGDAIVAQAQADAMYDAEQELGMGKSAAMVSDPVSYGQYQNETTGRSSVKPTDEARAKTRTSKGVGHYLGKPGRSIQSYGMGLEEAADTVAKSKRGLGNSFKRSVGKALSNKYVAHGAIPTALGVAGAAGAYAYNRRRNKSAADELYEAGYSDAMTKMAFGGLSPEQKEKARRGFTGLDEDLRAKEKATPFLKRPGEALQRKGFNMVNGGAGFGNKTKNIIGKALSNKYVAHGALPAALGVAGAAGAYAYNRSRKKSASLEAEILVDDLYNINFHTAMEQNVAAWREANGI